MRALVGIGSVMNDEFDPESEQASGSSILEQYLRPKLSASPLTTKFVLQYLDFDLSDGHAEENAKDLALFLLERREISRLLHFVSFFTEGSSCSLEHIPTTKNFFLVHIRGRGKLLLGDLDGAVDDFVFATAAYEVFGQRSSYLNDQWLEPPLTPYWGRCTDRGKYLMQCYRVLCESTVVGHKAVAVSFARFALGCVGTKDEFASSFFWSQLCNSSLENRDYEQARFAALANPLPKEVEASLKSIIAVAFSGLNLDRISCMSWPGYHSFVINTILRRCADSDVEYDRDNMIDGYEAVYQLHLQNKNHRGAAMVLYKAAERLMQESSRSVDSEHWFHVVSNLYKRSLRELEVAASTRNPSSQFFVVDEGEPRVIYGVGLEEEFRMRKSRKRVSPGSVDEIGRAMNTTSERVSLEMQNASGSMIITLKKLREKVAFATARKRLAKRILTTSSTVLITESEPELLYPVLLKNRLYDTAAHLASESQLSLEALFDALTKQYLSDQSRKDADISVIDESERKNPALECEYSDECVRGEELKYYLEHYGSSYHYLNAAKQILSSVSNVDLPKYIFDYLQGKQPWVLVSLYTNAGRLIDAGRITLSMLRSAVHRDERVPAQNIDKLVVNMELCSRSCHSEDDRQTYLSLLASIKSAFSAYLKN